MSHIYLRWQVGSLPLAPPGKPLPCSGFLETKIPVAAFSSREPCHTEGGGGEDRRRWGEQLGAPLPSLPL